MKLRDLSDACRQATTGFKEPLTAEFGEIKAKYEEIYDLCLKKTIFKNYQNLDIAVLKIVNFPARHILQS